LTLSVFQTVDDAFRKIFRKNKIFAHNPSLQ
jgi:hypothetical protein